MSPVLAGKFAGLLPDMHPGGIDFISGSGATVDYLIEQAVRRGLKFHSFVTVGNSVRTGATDVLALYDEEHERIGSKFIMLYLERVEDPGRLLKHARSLAAKGCVLMGVKSGTTEAGVRAAASHTGAAATSDTAVQALFDKAGIIRVGSRMEMIDLAMALTPAKGKLDGRRACVVTDAGGPGVMLADELNRQGISAPPFKPGTRELLAGTLPPGAAVGNPVDCGPTRNGEMMAKIFDVIAREEADALDYILFVCGDSGLTDNWGIYQATISAMDRLDMPVFPSFCSAISSAAALEKFRAAGKCHFEDEVSMARALGRMVNRPKIAELEPDPLGYNREAVGSLLAGVEGIAPPDLTRRVLAAAGIPAPAQAEIRDTAELEGLPAQIPFPWVMKVIGPLHKTDLGGVATGVGDSAAALEVWDRLMKIEGAVGVLVQETVAGLEALIGLSREGAFGHLAAVGLGGIYAEALGDVRFGLVPLAMEEARGLIRSIRGLGILEGARGREGMDLEVLADLLVRASLIAKDAPRLREMDVNPLMGRGKELKAVDVRIILGD
jgi:acetyltransferase